MRNKLVCYSTATSLPAAIDVLGNKTRDHKSGSNHSNAIKI